jgi:2-(3-amino-3-carboxypropyl)histidine synthase
MLMLAVSKLPQNYNFEILKSIVRIREVAKELEKSKPRVALQMPDGFMIWSILIADILSVFAPCECIILGDITYGACCIDDLGSKSLNCDFIVHYGHSCLVPITETCVKTLYVFVDIEIDIAHLVKTVEFNFPDKSVDLCIMGSIQYNNSVFVCKKELVERGYTKVRIPQTKPRSHGEVLGCTSPIIEEKSVIFICDGRFHMESAMIANEKSTFYQYNPFTKVLSIEQYDVDLMKKIRLSMINKSKPCKTVGIIFGILGRQGNPDILEVRIYLKFIRILRKFLKRRRLNFI